MCVLTETALTEVHSDKREGIRDVWIDRNHIDSGV